MNPRLQRLRAEIASDRAALSACLDELAALSLTPPAADRGDLARVAVALHHAYSAYETILVRLAREFEGEPAAGPDWHQALLDRMSLELEGVRPRVIAAESQAALRLLLGFRHFFRHAYAVALDPERLEALRSRAVSSRELLSADLDAIDAFLAGLACDGT